jgi:CelD/BcsL family acetyltransferase involved in cellulose biosynthesis
VDLHPLQAEGPLFDGILNAFRNAGMIAVSYFCFGNWYLEVKNRSYREYHDALPSRLRNTIRRKSERLAKTGRLRIEIVTNDDHLSGTIAAFEQIYNSSWKSPEPYPQFIPGLIRICAEGGWLRMGIAYIDDKPAAAQFWIVYQGVASIYKLAYDEKFSAESVGSILTAQLMQHVIDIDKVRQVDFLSGDDSYKKDWMSHRRERRGIIAYNLRTAHGLLGALRHMGGALWKRMARARSGGSGDLPRTDSAACDNPSR